MRRSPALLWLSALIATLALVAAGAGLLSQDGDGPFTFTTLRGESVTIYGRGLYRYDTLFGGAANRGTDAVTLALGIPLLLLSGLLYWRGSLRGGLNTRRSGLPPVPAAASRTSTMTRMTRLAGRPAPSTPPAAQGAATPFTGRTAMA